MQVDSRQVDIRRATDRPTTRLDGLDSRHSFSYGRHYDPGNTHHGVLMASNDVVVAPGGGFEDHPHQDMEIVTWVLRGSLVHQDSTGYSGVIYPGLAQRMSAGRGIVHSETNDAWRLEPDRSRDEPVRFVQMWVLPDETGTDAGYEQCAIADDLLLGRLVAVASGRDDETAAVGLRNRHATLHAARLRPGGTVELPVAPYLHLYVADGATTVAGAGELSAGDAVRFTNAGGQRVTATTAAEILVWEMHAALGD